MTLLDAVESSVPDAGPTPGAVARSGPARGRSRRYDRLRTAAKLVAYGGSAVTAVSFVGAGVLLSQARQVRREIPLVEAPPPRCEGVWGGRFSGRPITVAILGDSSAAGYGVHRTRETPGALLATGISRRLRRPVRLHRFAVVGAQSSWLRPQVDAALNIHPDLAVILIGANDVTHRASQVAAVQHLSDAVRRLRTGGCQVVVGTCPDLGAIAPLKPPLRWLARRWSRQLAAAQTVAVVGAGGRTVSLGDLLGPRFAAEPHRMFSWDRFHPSAAGYAAAVAAMLPTVLTALGEGDARPVALVPGNGVTSLAHAAHQAVKVGGTEVSATRVAGQENGPAGPWAMLRRRRAWFGQARPEEPEALCATTVPLQKPPSGGTQPSESTPQASASAGRSPSAAQPSPLEQ